MKMHQYWKASFYYHDIDSTCVAQPYCKASVKCYTFSYVLIVAFVLTFKQLNHNPFLMRPF